MTELTASFQKECFIPFHYVDAAGILFFGNVFSLAHQTFEAFVIEALQCPWSDWFQNSEWIVPIKQTEASFTAPLLTGQVCRIHLTVAEMRSSSFSLKYDFYQNEQLCCSVKTVHVFCQRLTSQKQPIPSHLAHALKNYTS